MTLRKHGTGEVIGVDPADQAEQIQTTASAQNWDADDEQALTDEQQED